MSTETLTVKQVADLIAAWNPVEHVPDDDTLRQLVAHARQWLADSDVKAQAEREAQERFECAERGERDLERDLERREILSRLGRFVIMLVGHQAVVGRQPDVGLPDDAVLHSISSAATDARDKLRELEVDDETDDEDDDAQDDDEVESPQDLCIEDIETWLGDVDLRHDPDQALYTIEMVNRLAYTVDRQPVIEVPPVIVAYQAASDIWVYGGNARAVLERAYRAGARTFEDAAIYGADYVVTDHAYSIAEAAKEAGIAADEPGLVEMTGTALLYVVGLELKAERRARRSKASPVEAQA